MKRTSVFADWVGFVIADWDWKWLMVSSFTRIVFRYPVVGWKVYHHWRLEEARMALFQEQGFFFELPNYP